ncbi:MAG: universal stress protein [Chitinophagaceae bacterium]|nr:MAG: universal stress protein [Chitinophagaceae bacterium]
MQDEGRERLKRAAENAGLTLHDGPLEDDEGIVEESRFADLVIVGAGLSFHEFSNESPSRFVMDLLPKMQCPVLVMPDDLQEIKEIYFAYNGGYSSVYALRQMIYLFPEFKRLPVTVLYVEEGRGGIPFERSLKDWLYNHFDNITIKLLKGDPASALMDELMPKKNILVTFGAFGRNKVSRFLRHSNAEGVLQVINVPVFITHP